MLPALPQAATSVQPTQPVRAELLRSAHTSSSDSSRLLRGGAWPGRCWPPGRRPAPPPPPPPPRFSCRSSFLRSLRGRLWPPRPRPPPSLPNSSRVSWAGSRGPPCRGPPGPLPRPLPLPLPRFMLRGWLYRPRPFLHCLGEFVQCNDWDACMCGELEFRAGLVVWKKIAGARLPSFGRRSGPATAAVH